MKLDERLRRITPYTPGEQPKDKNIIKLNTNENPYPPSPAFREALERIDPTQLRRYPDPEAGELVEALSEVYGVPREQIFVGVGSDEVLALSFLALFDGVSEEEPLVFPDVTYSFYPVWAQLYRIPFRAIPLDGAYRVKLQDYAHPAKRGGVVLPNPNAPTGVCESRDFFEKVLDANPDCAVIVDEAYIDFGGESALPLIEKHENLLVVQTCSKSWALAGLRIGFAFGSRKLIDAIKAVKFSFNSYTMNGAQIAAGAAAIRDVAYRDALCERIVKTRERMARELPRLCFSCLPSRANFLFAKHERIPGRALFEALRARGIYVRHWDTPRIADYLRITVGTEEEIDALLAALAKIVEVL